MSRMLEGSRAVAETVARCRPDVVAAYPISPQTHVVEALSRAVRAGELGDCRLLNVESETAAMSACIGAAVVGARPYTASASQGLLHMCEALFNAAGLGLPIVMTVANRAIGAPINIFNDHSDALSQRDSGWIQLFADSSQEAADLHVQAYRLAEELGLPVMVCMDGFVLTHAHEPIEVPAADAVDAFLPRRVPAQLLDPAHPTTIGAMVGPEAFTEVKVLMHHRQMTALDAIPRIAGEFAERFGRDSGGLVRGYRTDGADTVVVAMGSVLGALEEVVDELRARGERIGAAALRCFRPTPSEELREALAHARRVVVLERALAVGAGGIVGADVRLALAGWDVEVCDVVAGLGGRPVTRASLRRLLDRAIAGGLPPLSFLDLDRERLAAELAHRDGHPRPGGHAEHALAAAGLTGAQAAS